MELPGKDSSSSQNDLPASSGAKPISAVQSVPSRGRATTAHQYLNLFGALQHVLVFAALLVAVPLTAFPWMPLHSLLGGLFVGLGQWEVYFTTIAAMGAAWSLLFVAGLSVEAVARRQGAEPSSLPRTERCSDIHDHLPRWSQSALCVPARWSTLLIFTGVALPTLMSITVHAERGPLRSLFFAAMGAASAYLLIVLTAAPVYAVDGDYVPLPDRHFAPRVWRLVQRMAPLVWLMRRVRSITTRFVELTPFDDIVDPKTGELETDHFFAAMSAVGVAALMAATYALFLPPEPRFSLPELPPAALLFMLCMEFIWVVGALTYHFSRFHVSPALVALLVIYGGYRVTGRDHYFELSHSPQSLPVASALDVARAHSGKNLVVVTSTGGGILAAGWTTLALQRLITARPELQQEIRLISAVSGGAVGTAFFVDELRRASSAPLKVRLQSIHERSVLSSLAAVSYGLVYLDVLPLLTAGILPFWTDRDRGQLLDEKWQYNAGRSRDTLLSELTGPILAGDIPAPILNTTVMETGRRVMITPMAFTGSSERSVPQSPGVAGPTYLPPRSQTLPEYLGEAHDELDISLWTAARLSATFPYVTPAARSDMDHDERPVLSHHMIDGGYYDNYGIASALEWLDAVLDARSRDELSFERILVIQLRASHPAEPTRAEPQNGVMSALVGPLIGVLNIRDGAAVSRNATELHRFLEHWNARLGTRWANEKPNERRPVTLRTVVFQPPLDDPGPLSWHLTSEQIEALHQRWPESGPEGEIAEQLAILHDFLGSSE